MRNVLIVEDEHINAFIIQKFVGEHYAVQLAQNGNEALDLIDTNSFDIILMDINLGDEELDGIEVMKRLRKIPSKADTPVIAVTAYAMPEDRQRFLNEGFDGYVPKPIIKAEILQQMATLLPE